MAKQINTVVASKKSVKLTAVAPVAPAIPMATEGSITDPKRRLTREEWREMSPEEKRARREARAAARPGVSARLAKNMDRFARRCRKVLAMLGEGDETENARLQMSRAVVSLAAAQEAFAELPVGWQPTRRAGAEREAKFAIGDFVSIHEKRRGNYDGLLDADEMSDLRVIKIAGKRLVVQTEGGTRMFLPTNAVVRAHG